MKKWSLWGKRGWVYVFFCLILPLVFSEHSFEKETMAGEEIFPKFSFGAGIYSLEDNVLAYGGSVDYLIESGRFGLDVYFCPEEKRKNFSGKLSLMGKVEEPEVEGELVAVLNWWYRKREGDSKNIYSFFVGEKLKFPLQTYLYAELGIAYPSNIKHPLWGWNVKAGWVATSWMELNVQYGQFLAKERELMDYKQWIVKGELNFSLGGIITSLGYEKSNANNPLYLLNTHFLEATYIYVHIFF